jgi:hypothetical protein
MKRIGKAVMIPQLQVAKTASYGRKCRLSSKKGENLPYMPQLRNSSQLRTRKMSQRVEEKSINNHTTPQRNHITTANLDCCTQMLIRGILLLVILSNEKPRQGEKYHMCKYNMRHEQMPLSSYEQSNMGENSCQNSTDD